MLLMRFPLRGEGRVRKVRQTMVDAVPIVIADPCPSDASGLRGAGWWKGDGFAIPFNRGPSYLSATVGRVV